MDPLPKPTPQAVIEAILVETEAAVVQLEPHLGAIEERAERVLRGVIARAVERGIELQREAHGVGIDQDSIITPMLPPRSEAPGPDVVITPTRHIRAEQELTEEAEKLGLYDDEPIDPSKAITRPLRRLPRGV